MKLTEKQRRVQTIANALDDPNYEVVMRHSDIIGEALVHGFHAQQFFTKLAPTLRSHGISTPPSLHTWRAVRKELNRRAAARLSNSRD